LSEQEPPPAHEPESGQDRLLALLIALPALAIAWPGPGNPVAGDFATTELSGTGVALLAALPAALYSAWLRPRPARALFLLLCAWLAISLRPGTTESLQSDRAWMGLLTGLTLALAAGNLGAAGWNTLVWALATISSILVIGALARPSTGGGGVLGNSGELSGAALPGALCGMMLWARCRSGWRWVGLVAVGVFGLHAFVTPVLASLLILLVVGGSAGLLAKGALEPRARARLAFVALLAILGLVGTQLGWSRLGDDPAPAGEAIDQPAPSSTGGIEVRYRIWGATLPMIADTPFIGVGAGQFATAFPPYRDQEEIELSSWHRLVENTTEVEHPHNDWLTFFVEGGLAGGIAWSALLGLLGVIALRRLRHQSTPVEAAIAAGVLGTLLGALVNCPLTFNPAASVTSFALFGALLGGRRVASPRDRYGRLLAPAAAIAMILYVPRAHAMWELGDSIAEIGGTESLTAKEIATDDGLAACPDSVVALSLKARFLADRAGDREGALALWNRVLALRPYRFEALQISGILLAREGRLDEAGARFDRALEIDGGHPGLIRSRIYNLAERGKIEQSLAEVDRLEATGHFRPIDVMKQACTLILRGQDREGLPLLQRADERFENLTAELAWALDAEYRRSGNALQADAFKALAHALWAREHAAAGRWADARRQYRQSLRVNCDYVPRPGPPRLRMEFAAVLWQSREREDAEALLEGLEPRLVDWVAIPTWAGEVLLEMGFGVEKY